mmetsp:Transcript_52/g.94  ORF Transcript_52/g.94 Transcript_52/m.94 type:complete len:403 (+) Transcript_52:88-1296(+)
MDLVRETAARRKRQTAASEGKSRQNAAGGGRTLGSKRAMERDSGHTNQDQNNNGNRAKRGRESSDKDARSGQLSMAPIFNQASNRRRKSDFAQSQKRTGPPKNARTHPSGSREKEEGLLGSTCARVEQRKETTTRIEKSGNPGHRETKTKKKKKKKKEAGAVITAISWNLAECTPSKVAPDWWSSSESKASVASIISSKKPIIVALQEAPEDLFLALNHDYKLVGKTKSHAPGVVMLLIRKDIDWEPETTLIGGPVVACRILVAGLRLGVASVHLAPFKQNAGVRNEQMCDVIKALPRGIILGDTNMRAAEGNKYQGLLDAWKGVGKPVGQRYTWDSHKNWYHGSQAFRFTCRFDRAYADQELLKPRSFELIGSEPIMGNGHHFLSDHFGFAATWTIKPKSK